MIRYRSTAVSTKGMVASSHPLASLSGLRVLMDGGNAFDAAIATNATLNVTQPHVCGIGGDAFYLLYSRRKGRVESINASGRSSHNASIDFFNDKGLTDIPSRGILAAINVPGCVAGWFELHNRYGSYPIARLLRDAIEYAEKGFPISHQLSGSISNAFRLFQKETEWRRVYTPNGSAPKPGSVLVQPDLAWSLRLIAEKGRSAFYEGEIASRIVNSMKGHGGIIDSEDLSACSADWEEPISSEYRGFRIYETAPNSQAITALFAFNLLKKFDLPRISNSSAEYFQIMLESCKIAYEYRDRYLTDPNDMKISTSELFQLASSEKEFSRVRQKIGNSSQEVLPLSDNSKEDGDTTYYCVADEEGNCVSSIQSLYFGFGSGFIPERTGIVLQNRGSYFSLDENHHNVLRPRKRTFHTLCASLTTSNDEPYLLFGSMGGDVQPQIHQQVISSILDYATDIQQAIEDPRWAMTGTIYDRRKSISLESRFDADLVTQLKNLGYEITMEDELWPTTGHAQGIILSKERVLLGGADPRGDGAALGY